MLDMILIVLISVILTFALLFLFSVIAYEVLKFFDKWEGEDK